MEEMTTCSKCQTQLGENDTFCNNCGYPERGTSEEQGKYNYSIELKKNVVDNARKKLKNVKTLLYVLAGLNFLVGIYFLSNEMTFNDGIGSFISSIIFLGCVVWVNKQPLTGILAAFIFWILLQLSVVLVDPVLLFNGIILKVIFIGIFVKGISSAKDAKNYINQLKDVKAI